MIWLSYNWGHIASLFFTHLALTIPALVGAFALALPLGRLAFRFPRLGSVISTLTSVVYAIPALALLIIVPLVLQIPLRSNLNVIIALLLYGAALQVRSVVDAFGSVDPGPINSATTMGLSKRSVFWQVELPLALPVIGEGFRVVSVATVGLVTIGALIGVPSLGSLLTDGLQRGIIVEVLVGLLLTAILALLLDLLLVALFRLLTPWMRQRDPGEKE